MDLRPDTKFEKVLPYTFYVPLSVVYLGIMFCTAIVTLYLGVVLLCQRGDPTEKQIESVDANSLNEITLSRLTELNKARDEDKHLRFGEVILVYTTLNLRTQFEADDVFSQKTAVMTHLQNLIYNQDSYKAGSDHAKALENEDEDENYARMKKHTQVEVSKSRSFIRQIILMELLSLLVSFLALSQIFSGFLQLRALVLSPFINTILRICFGIIILFIAYRDAMQIMINLSCRISGVVCSPEASRFVLVQSLVRILVTILAVIAILLTIFSAAKDEPEGVID